MDICTCGHPGEAHTGFSGKDESCTYLGCGCPLFGVPPADDPISPGHYKLNLPGNIEVRDILRAQGILEEACEANVLKYMLRWRNKNGLEDLKKAFTYLGWLIEELE